MYLFTFIDEAADFTKAEEFRRKYVYRGRQSGKTFAAEWAKEAASIQEEISSLVCEWNEDSYRPTRRVHTIYSDKVTELFGEPVPTGDVGSIILQGIRASQVSRRARNGGRDPQPLAPPFGVRAAQAQISDGDAIDGGTEPPKSRDKE